MIEILLAMLMQMSSSAGVLLFMLCVVGAIGLIFSPVIVDIVGLKPGEAFKGVSSFLLKKKVLCALGALVLFSSIPSMDQVWKMRISLIKFHLASPENINKAGSEIERIAKKLECKYIGCEGEKK